jgi:hypothetical protein
MMRIARIITDICLIQRKSIMSRSKLSDKKRLVRNASLLLLLAMAAPMLFLGQRVQPRIPGQWIKGRNLSDARAGACTVSLSDGRMLTTGGQGRSGALASAELLTGAGDSTPVSPMGSARSEHVCATLDDGRVLVAGGRVAGDAATNAAEIYDVASDSWTSILSMREARIGATLTRIPGGRLLIAGGEAAGLPSATLEIFDPSSGAFTLASGAMSSSRKGHAASLLRDGRVLIAGGIGGEGKTVLDTAEVFDPANGSIRMIGRMMVAREGLSATLLDNGRVLIAGGSDGAADLASSELFDAATMSFSAGPAMSSPRRGHKAFLMPHNNTVVMVGGEAAGEALASTEQFAWWGNRYAGTFKKLGDLSSGRTQITGAPTDAGMLMVAGGMAGRAVVSASRDAASVATVITDKPDYHPGEIVYLSGNGFGPNDVVHVVIHETPDEHPDVSVNVQADANGAFNNVDVYHVEVRDLGVAFHLIATGDPSGITAETSFTDARNLLLTFAGSGGGSVTITPSTGTVEAPVGCGGTGTNASSQTVSATCLPNITVSDSAATVTFNATAAAGSTFGGWSSAANLSPSTCTGTTNPCSAVLGANPSLTVTFNSAPTVSITVATSPAGRQISVDGGGPLTAPQTFSWVAGSNHTITTTSPQTVGTTRYVFNNWSDTGAISHSITVPASPTTYTANFTTQYQLTFAQSGISGDTGANTVVMVNGSPKAAGVLPFSDWFDSVSSLTYSYSDPVASSVTGKRYALTTPAASPASPITVSGAATVTGTYKAQFQIIFAQSGIGADSTGTAVTVAGRPKTASDLPFTTDWLDSGSNLT